MTATIETAMIQPRCCITGCESELVAEVHEFHYAKLLKRLRGIERGRGWERRRIGEERFYVCQAHLDDERLAGIHWEFLIEKETRI
jgi:hypothetical protein